MCACVCCCCCCFCCIGPKYSARPYDFQPGHLDPDRAPPARHGKVRERRPVVARQWQQAQDLPWREQTGSRRKGDTEAGETTEFINKIVLVFYGCEPVWPSGKALGW